MAGDSKGMERCSRSGQGGAASQARVELRSVADAELQAGKGKAVAKEEDEAAEGDVVQEERTGEGAVRRGVTKCGPGEEGGDGERRW